MNPRQIIILDIYENCAYDIQQELKMLYGNKLDLQVELLFDKKLSWVHVKGHNGNVENEIVDKFANLVSQI